MNSMVEPPGDDLEVALTFDELVDTMRESVAALEAQIDELEPAVRDYVVAIRAALDRYDEDRDFL